MCPTRDELEFREESLGQESVAPSSPDQATTPLRPDRKASTAAATPEPSITVTAQLLYPTTSPKPALVSEPPGPYSPEPSGEPSAPGDGTRFQAPQAGTGDDTSAIEELSPDDVEQVTSSNMVLGTTLGGKYRIVSELGAGGMGRVYRARDLSLQRDVAIKVMRESFLESASEDVKKLFEQRFEVEARLPAAISHPNIVAIHDRGVHQELSYLVMEFLPGSRSLADLVKEAMAAKKFIETELVRDIFLQIASALRAVHSRPGTFHRDIKLDNILLCDLPGGGQVVKLIDFGIAHEDSSDRTQTGLLLGTPRYLAPEFFEYDEECRPLVMDHRADLYALGVVLYQVLVLRRPYANISDVREAMASFKSTTNYPAPPTEFRPSISVGWDFVTMKLLARNREYRYHSAADLMVDLKHLEALPPYEGPGARQRPAADSILKPVQPAPQEPGQDPRDPAPPELPAHEDPDAASLSAFGVGPQASPAGTTSQPSNPSGSETGAAASASQPSTSNLQSLSGALPSPARPGAPGPVLPTQATSSTDAWAPAPDDGSKKGMRLALVAGAAFIAVLIGVGAIVKGLETLSARNEVASTEWDPPEADQARRDRAEWMKAMQDEAPPVRPEPVVKAPPAPAPQEPVAEPAPGPRKTTSRPATTRKASTPSPETAAAQPAAPPVDDYAAIYGTANKDLSGGTVTMRVNQDSTEPSAAGSVAGKVISATLLSDVADRPAGAAVIARVTKAMTLGSKRIPAGAEAHGTVTSSSGLRIFVEFNLFRLSDGSTITFKGTATDPRGRQGIPGKKLLNAGTATGVAANVGGNLVDQAGSVLAENVDSKLARAGVTSSFSETGRRSGALSTEEDAVVASKGTAFSIYVQSVD
ncbi:MAG: protein kinase [Pseudomonadota bacterium]